MPIPADKDTLILDMRCVAAVFEDRIEALQKELALIGVDCTVEEIMSHGEVHLDAWRMTDPDKNTCYLCSRVRTDVKGLCPCFNRVKATRYYDVTDVFALTMLDPETVVETIVCGCCGQLRPITAAAVRGSHERTGGYRGFKACDVCHKGRQAARRAAASKPRIERAAPQQAVVAPREAAPLQPKVQKREKRAWQAHKPAPEPLRYNMRIPGQEAAQEATRAAQALAQEVAGQVQAGDA